MRIQLAFESVNALWKSKELVQSVFLPHLLNELNRKKEIGHIMGEDHKAGTNEQIPTIFSITAGPPQSGFCIPTNDTMTLLSSVPSSHRLPTNILDRLCTLRPGWDPTTIARPLVSFCQDAGAILLDMNPDKSTANKLREEIEAGGDALADLHPWRLEPGHLGAIISVITSDVREVKYYRARLARLRSLSHLTIEVSHRS